MNKTSFFKKHVLNCAIVLFVFCALIILMPIQMVKANAAPPPDPTVGGVGPYQPQKTNVQMLSETILIDVLPSPSNLEESKQIRVNAKFTMRNQGQTEEQMQVIFPLTRLGYDGSSEQALYRVDKSSFAVKVSGQFVPITEITTPPELSAYDREYGFPPEVQWAAFDVTFPANEDVLLQVDYEMLNEFGMYGEGFTGIAYILETGAGWYGDILSADITLRLPYPVTEEAIWSAKPGYAISGNEMRWKLKDFEPTREDNLGVGVIHVDLWQTILELRSKVELNSEDENAWAELGDIYWKLGIFLGREAQLYYQVNHHFANLSLEARQKVVDLCPEWGDAHFKLAEILWFNNPKVEESFSLHGKVKSYIQSDDPTIQEVLHELDLAWSFGISEDIDSWDVEHFLRFVNSAIPSLELASPAKSTATNVSPTKTLARISTNTVFPKDSPTLTPFVPPTPTPTKTPSYTHYEVLIITAIGFIFVVGAFVYLWISRSRGKR